MVEQDRISLRTIHNYCENKDKLKSNSNSLNENNGDPNLGKGKAPVRHPGKEVCKSEATLSSWL